ncbi:hypothetical protein C5167_049313 [Papaver somniferum]|uniref:Rhodanese domain-containing protein n=1 Tax=Papaver somniferum TaxID=3469 RepID=A0A4Y7KLW8_PAPSO|nr:rhodanese-like domain-containing protein 14, chloroplastic [Papaver somniferum]RZC73837.1 hypothetical protein C5167_049313 [Papaver somniferum]
MASLIQIASHSSLTSTTTANLNPSLFSSSTMLNSSSNLNFNYSGITVFRSSSKKFSSLKVFSAATKQAKSPAEEEWKIKREVLLRKRVRSVDVKEAFRLTNENNYVLLDVRPEAEFKEAHAPGAVNVQIYRLIKEWTAWDIARRAAFAFFGIFAGTEENPEFLQLVESKLDKNSKIIVACSSGGTMKPTQNLPQGQQSRSLIAAYLLVLNGYTNVFHLEGGLYSWFKEDLPSVTEEEE